MSTPAVSVVMPTYNGEKYLVQQLQSILKQNLKPAEIIVCDDNSTDGTSTILTDFAIKKLIRLYKNPTSLGVVENIKKATSLTAPKNFVAFADQDDIWLPDKLGTLSELMLTRTDLSKPAMVFSDLSIINKKNEIIKRSLWNEFTIDPGTQTFKTLLLRNIVSGCTMLINDKMVNEVLKMPQSAYLHDAWITFIAFAFKNYAYTDKALVNYRQHDSNVTFSIAAGALSTNTGFFSKIKEYITGIVTDKPLLYKEFVMAETFYQTFRSVMVADDIKDFEEFLSLKNRNFYFKKMHIRRVNQVEIGEKFKK